MESHGIAIPKFLDDLMLYSDLINPTQTSHRLADVVVRFESNPLAETGEIQ